MPRPENTPWSIYKLKRTVQLSDRTKLSLIKQVQEYEKRGYECIEPIHEFTYTVPDREYKQTKKRVGHHFVPTEPQWDKRWRVFMTLKQKEETA